MPHAQISSFDARVFADHLAPGEELLDVFHRHWIALLPPFFRLLLPAVVLGTLLLIALPLTGTVVVVTTLGIIVLTLWAIFTVYDWYCDVFLLTTMSLMLIDWQNPFRVSIERIEYDSIDIVKHEHLGILSTLMDFGSLVITTANATHRLRTVQHPEHMQERLMAIRDHLNNAGKGEDAVDIDVLRRALKSILAQDDDEDDGPADPLPPEPPMVTDVRPPA